MNNSKFNDVMSSINYHIQNVRRFKIGKTGQNLNDRFKQQHESEGYDKIIGIGTSNDNQEVDQLEKNLIHHFQNNLKCDNNQIGGGEMTFSNKY